MNYQIIPILLEEKVKRYAYLIHNDNKSILIDPGSKHHIPMLLETLKKHLSISDIAYIILQSNDYLNLSSLDDLNKAGFNGQVVANETGIAYLNDMLDNDILSISSLGYQLKVSDKLTLDFIPIPFLPFPECFMTIFKEEGILFSAHLFSQSDSHDETLEKTILSINHFHEMILPSVEFVRQSIKKLKKYNLILIYPRLGSVLQRIMIPDIYAKVLAYDFYNSNQVIEYKNNKNVSYNYETIINHMLKRLESKYHRSDILDVFKDSEIHLELYPHIEIESTVLREYKLWNGFFDIIYQKKGIPWLITLEPIVKKYHHTYNIKLPTIYKTSFVEQESKIADLNLEKTHLKEKVLVLSSKISETTDKLLRCEITDLYNQKFMIGHLLNNLDKSLEENHVRGLILVHIDNLLEINKKYGTHKGNETLKNLVHLMQNIKTEDTLLFKQTGPGIYVYKHDIEEKALINFALNLSNQVKKSDLFIQDITISISISTTKELNDKYPLDERVNQFIELSQMRLERAKLKGKAQILDKTRDEDAYIEGIILLVDEDETYQNLMVRIFDRIHYKLILASDIYEAYEKLENHNIDIIISEINLSKLDGFQLKQKINESLTYKNIPFFMVSHLKNLDVINRCNLLDIDLILQKPIIPDELIGHIKRNRDKKVKL
ncbi:MAG: response regulator [Acholeplasmataceae bacterium]|nr:response regulator [Acholeplasmataceae bacterium]